MIEVELDQTSFLSALIPKLRSGEEAGQVERRDFQTQFGAHGRSHRYEVRRERQLQVKQGDGSL